MSTALKATLMALAVGCVLLVAGGFPLAGAPGVYRGGLMLLLGLAVGALSLWGAWRIARGHVLRMVCGGVCVLLTCAGVGGCIAFGKMSWDYAQRGGALWFGALAMGCFALVSLLFIGIFLFFTLRVMTRQLWLAALHAAVALVLVGAYTDALCAVSLPYRCVVGAAAADTPGLPFRLQVLRFDALRYAEAPTYALLEYRADAWVQVGAPELKGEELALGEQRWPLSSLKMVPGMPHPMLFLSTEPPRVLIRRDAAGAVREYSALCRLCQPDGSGAQEMPLRVNEPITYAGRLIYLMNYTERGGHTQVELLVRYAPGRGPALAGMLALILCSVGWCFTPATKPKD